MRHAIQHGFAPAALIALLSACGTRVDEKPLAMPIYDAAIRPLASVGARYPQSAHAKGIEGYVVLRYRITVMGVVDDDSITVVDASPTGVFERAAIAALKLHRFQPRTYPDTGRTVRFEFSADQ